MLAKKIVTPNQYNLVQHFNYFNSKFFNNELPPVKLSWHADDKSSGLTVCKFGRVDGKIVVDPGSIEIFISDNYARPIDIFDAVLLHEMIHAYFFSKNDINEQHGVKFQQMAAKFSKMLGIKIPITDSMEAVVDERSNPIMVMACYYPNRISFTIFNGRENPNELRNKIGRIKKNDRNIKEIRLYKINTDFWQKAFHNSNSDPFTFKDRQTQDFALHELENYGSLLLKI